MLLSRIIKAIASPRAFESRAVQDSGNIVSELRANIDSRNAMSRIGDGIRNPQGSVLSRAAADATRASFIAELNMNK